MNRTIHTYVRLVRTTYYHYTVIFPIPRGFVLPCNLENMAFKFAVKFNKIHKLLKIYKVKFVSFIRVSFLAKKMECALKINNSNKV